MRFKLNWENIIWPWCNLQVWFKWNCY